MARPLRPKPFDESRIRGKDVYVREYPSKANLPHSVTRGLVRGLLIYFSEPRRRTVIEPVFFDVIEEALIVQGERVDSEDRDDNEKINQLACSVVKAIDALLAHPTLDVLAEECQRLNPLFEEYNRLTRKIPRKNWLKEHLPNILTSLSQESRCTLRAARGPRDPAGCRRRTDMPTEQDLDKWAASNGIRTALFHILAHHHGSTYATIKEHYDRSAPRRAPGNKGPLKPQDVKPGEFV